MRRKAVGGWDERKDVTNLEIAFVVVVIVRRKWKRVLSQVGKRREEGEDATG